MPDALIGHTGFVGGVVRTAHAFEATYNSSNIDSIRGRSYELIVCAGAPAEKWKANQDPDADLENLRHLMRCMADVRAEHLVLVSTVDVYPNPVDVDEQTPIDPDTGTAYGRHRYELECFCADRFETTIVRLPALFGPGLKKNAIYDLLHDDRIEMINPDSEFQFYNLSNVWADIERIRKQELPLVNVSTEPLAMGDIAREAFGIDFENPAAPPSARYDFRSRYAELLGGLNGYLYDRTQVMAELAEFVRLQRAAAGTGRVG